MARTGKAEKTRQRIIEASAPVFNKQGFAGTSMSDILKVTGLTKGGVYGNFSGKEELALEAFEYNKEKLFLGLEKHLKGKEGALEKLHTFFRAHGLVIQQFSGGCPILNTAIEADDTHHELKKRARAAVLIWVNYLKGVIRSGIDKGEIRDTVDEERISRMLISLLEGAVFMGKLLDKPDAYKDVIRHIRRVIDVELINIEMLKK